MEDYKNHNDASVKTPVFKKKKIKKKSIKKYQARKKTPPHLSLPLYLKWLIHPVNLIISGKYS